MREVRQIAYSFVPPHLILKRYKGDPGVFFGQIAGAPARAGRRHAEDRPKRQASLMAKAPACRLLAGSAAAKTSP